METLTQSAPTLTTTQKKEFDDNGFLVVPGLISGDLLKNIQKGYAKTVAGEIESEDWANQFKPGQLLQLPGPSKNLKELQGEEHLDLMVEVARQLFDESVCFWYDQLIFKPAGNPWETLWHQDAGYWNNMPDDRPAVTAWLAVEDVAEDMGCMSFVPGSHKEKRIEHRDASDDNPISGALQAVCDPDEVVKVPLRAGDVSFHHKYTLHYTSGNHGKADRCGLVNHLRGM